MKKKTLHHKHLLLAKITIASIGLVMASGPVVAQQASAKWKPRMETVTVTAGAPFKNWRGILTGTNFKEAFAVSASIPVPYSDLNLAREPGATELARRIKVAARLVCLQIDIKYPSSKYPTLGDDDCEQMATQDGMDHANAVIAAASKG